MNTIIEGQGILLGLGFLVLGFFFHAYLVKANAIAASKRAKTILSDAEREAELLRGEAKINAKDAVIRAREKTELELNTQRQNLFDLEKRVTEREKNLTSKLDLLNAKELDISGRIAELADERQTLKDEKQHLKILQEKQKALITEASLLSPKEAEKRVMSRLEQEVAAEQQRYIRHHVRAAKEEAQTRSIEIITTAIQRYAGDAISEIATSSIHLKDESFKGRIIGKEGRNIKAFEMATGVNVIIDEAPDIILLSSFNPIHREVAKRALEELIKDGRIQPVKIEETVERVRSEVDDLMREAGQQALNTLKIQGVAPELISLLGKLKFRTSYRQNVLDHSVESALLMGLMAAELNLDVDMARRVGIFHDIGEAADHGMEGSHAIAGAQLLRKHGEQSLVWNAVGAHHEEMEARSPYAVLCEAADTLTAARPGARLETTQLFLERMQQIEKIAMQTVGVKSCYALQAGREVRVLVDPEQVDDSNALLMARKLAKDLHEKVTIPGTVRVVVIRETRCVEFTT